MTSTLALLLALFQVPKCTDCLELVHQIFVSAAKNAQPEIDHYAPADGLVGVNLVSFVCGISTAAGRDYTAAEVQQAMGGVFRKMTAGEARWNSFYIELNGLFVSPGRAEATLTLQWTLRSDGVQYEIGTRTVRIILIHNQQGWVQDSTETIHTSG